MAKRKQREKAPYPDGDVGVLLRFVNTILDDEIFDSPEKLVTWMSAHGFMSASASVSKEDQEQAVRFRGGLFKLLLARVRRQRVPAEFVESLNAAMGPASYLTSLDKDGHATRTVVTEGWAGARARLADALVQLQGEGMDKLKICTNCAEFFFPRSQAAQWCSGRCGSRGTSATYRDRRRRR